MKKVRWLIDTEYHQKDSISELSEKVVDSYIEKGQCQLIENEVEQERTEQQTDIDKNIAFHQYEIINLLPDDAYKHRAWLLDYEGLHFSIGLNGSDLVKWQENKDQYVYSNKLWDGWYEELSYCIDGKWSEKYFYAKDINKIERHKQRLIIEFDDKDLSKIPQHIQAVKDKLKELGYGYIESSHKGKSNYIWVEFTRDLTTEEAKNFLKWISPKGSEIDLNFTSDNFRFPILYAAHWKHGHIEQPIEYHKGNKIDYDSLNIKPVHVKTKISHKGYETYEKEEDKIKSYLCEDRKKYESLGCGYFNETFYFGTTLFRDGEKFSAIVTDTKQIYINTRKNNEIRNIFGLNYKSDFYSDGLDNIFSKEAIKKWISSDCEDITIESVYNKYVNLLKQYIYFEDQRNYSLLACYRIASFFMSIWRARGRLYLWAEPGSAKSRLTQILHNTGFNSIALGDWTLPYIQRLIESTRGETHIDDFETLPEDQQKATIRLVKVGFMKGFKAGKISDNKNKEPETFDLFNTTTINNTVGLDFITTDRCIIVRLPKIAKKQYDKEPNFDDLVWSDLRDSLYILGLKYGKIIKETYDLIDSEKIKGRLLLIIKPELTIAKLISKEVFEDIEDLWIEEISQRKTIDFEKDWEFLAYKFIYDKLLSYPPNSTLSTLSTTTTLSTLSTLSTDEYFNLKEITDPILLELYGGLKEDYSQEYNKKKQSISIVVGNILSRNPIFHSRRVKGVTQYKVSAKEYEDFLIAKGYLRIIKEILEVD